MSFGMEGGDKKSVGLDKGPMVGACVVAGGGRVESAEEGLEGRDVGRGDRERGVEVDDSTLAAEAVDVAHVDTGHVLSAGADDAACQLHHCVGDEGPLGGGAAALVLLGPGQGRRVVANPLDGDGVGGGHPAACAKAAGAKHGKEAAQELAVVLVLR